MQYVSFTRIKISALVLLFKLLMLVSVSAFSDELTTQLTPATPPTPAPSINSPTKESVQVVVLGDSLSAEYGLERGTGWVSLLEVQLAKQRPPQTRIINASISGETTSGGRSRLALLLTKYSPQVLIIELGSNDALRGISIEASQANLDWMVQRALDNKIKVLIVGNLVPANYGATLNKELSNMYLQVARKHKVSLVPFMLKGVADVPNASRLFQADQLHPLAVAHPTILSNIWPELRKLL